tara:strand:+ start:6121 stop:6942 length:822 start_codon:yes stop_codon:yes gene_type:complete
MPKCKNDPRRRYKGTEPSPKGLGYCAHAEPIKTRRIGKDNNPWIIQKTQNGIKRWVKDNIICDVSSFVKTISINFSELKPKKNKVHSCLLEKNTLKLKFSSSLILELDSYEIILNLKKNNTHVYDNLKDIWINASHNGLIIDIWFNCKKNMKIYNNFIKQMLENHRDNWNKYDARLNSNIKLHHYGELIRINQSILKKLNKKNSYFVIDSSSGEGWDSDYSGKYIAVMSPNEIKEFYFSGDFNFRDGFDFPIFIVRQWNKTFDHSKLKGSLYK